VLRTPPRSLVYVSTHLLQDGIISDGRRCFRRGEEFDNDGCILTKMISSSKDENGSMSDLDTGGSGTGGGCER
jgi:hypothetical protein